MSFFLSQTTSSPRKRKVDAIANTTTSQSSNSDSHPDKRPCTNFCTKEALKDAKFDEHHIIEMQWISYIKRFEQLRNEKKNVNTMLTRDEFNEYVPLENYLYPTFTPATNIKPDIENQKYVVYKTRNTEPPQYVTKVHGTIRKTNDTIQQQVRDFHTRSKDNQVQRLRPIQVVPNQTYGNQCEQADSTIFTFTHFQNKNKFISYKFQKERRVLTTVEYAKSSGFHQDRKDLLQSIGKLYVKPDQTERWMYLHVQIQGSLAPIHDAYVAFTPWDSRTRNAYNCLVSNAQAIVGKGNEFILGMPFPIEVRDNKEYAMWVLYENQQNRLERLATKKSHATAWRTPILNYTQSPVNLDSNSSSELNQYTDLDNAQGSKENDTSRAEYIGTHRPQILQNSSARRPQILQDFSEQEEDQDEEVRIYDWAREQVDDDEQYKKTKYNGNVSISILEIEGNQHYRINVSENLQRSKQKRALQRVVEGNIDQCFWGILY